MTAVEWLMDKYRTQNGVIASSDYHECIIIYSV